MNPTQPPEFSYSLSVSAVVSAVDGVSVDHEASDAERQALAARLGQEDISALRFTVHVKPAPTGNGFRLRGRIVADVVQRCVVTLEPVTGHIDEPVELLLFDEDELRQGSVETEEDYETFSGGLIDLGEIAAVELALSLDPYPRAPGVTGDAAGPGAPSAESPAEYTADQDPENRTYRPFEGLAALQRKR